MLKTQYILVEKKFNRIGMKLWRGHQWPYCQVQRPLNGPAYPYSLWSWLLMEQMNLGSHRFRNGLCVRKWLKWNSKQKNVNKCDNKIKKKSICKKSNEKANKNTFFLFDHIIISSPWWTWFEWSLWKIHI